MDLNLRILSWNARGWQNTYHLPHIQQLFQTYDILIIYETWMRHAQIPAYTPPGFLARYTSYPEPLQGRINGGLLFYYRDSLSPTFHHFPTEQWRPIVWVECYNLIIGAAYLPHEGSVYLTHWALEPIEELYQQAEAYQDQFPQHSIIVLGDFNARRNIPPHDHRWTPRGRLLHYNLPEDWTIHADGPTFHSDDLHTSCVDYILLSPTAQLQNPLCDTHPFTTDSDHARLSIYIDVSGPSPPEPEPLPFTKPPPILNPTPIDESERALLAQTVKDNRYTEAFHFRPDTTALNRARRRLKLSAKQLLNGQRSEARLAIHKQLRNRVTKERNRVQAARLTARQQYLKSLPPKDWYKMARPLLSGKSSNTVLASGPALEQHYSSLLYQNMPPIPPAPTPLAPNPLFDRPFTEIEVTSAVSRLRNSATGEDRVTSDQIRQLSTEYLCQHLNHILNTKEIPSTWKRSILVTIPKGSAEASKDPANTRGIALQPAMRKLFTLLLYTRLQEYTEENSLLPPLQNGFRLNHRTADNIFILRTLHEKALLTKSPLIIAQIDIRKAFDSVDRAKLFEDLYSLGIHGSLIEVLRLAYSGQEITVRANKR